MDLQAIIDKIQILKSQTSACTTSEAKTSYKCGICCDEGGYAKRNDEGYDVYVVCNCFKQGRAERIINSSQITVEFRKKTFQTFNPAFLPDMVRNIHRCALQYASNFKNIQHNRYNSIALLGQSGSGKTHLLMAVSNQIIAMNIPILYFPFVEGFNEIKNDLDNLEKRINKLQTIDVLFIDDLFKGRKEPTPFQMEQIFAVINYRYMNNLPVLISSEKTIEEIINFDEAIGSRIYEMTRDYRVEVLGKGINYRIRGDENEQR
jgi:DNA replication protein DnaC